MATKSVLLWAGLSLVALSGQASSTQPADVYARIDIHEIGYERLEAIRSDPALAWWIELDDTLLVATTTDRLPALEMAEHIEALETLPRPDRLRILQLGHGPTEESPEVEWLASGGRHAVVQLSAEYAEVATDRNLLPFRENLVLARQVANQRIERSRLAASAATQGLVDRVDPQRWFGDAEHLASFNRYTHGPGVHDARDWIAARFGEIPELAVATDDFIVGATTAYNVVATRIGSATPNRWIVIGGHYDSISENPDQSAPGAEDNASGCAGVLEMARVLSNSPTNATLIFICYSGEEQGLYGSESHAADLEATGDDEKIDLMLNMDMIGYTGDSDIDCLLETSPANASLADVFAEAAATYTDLRTVITLFAFGSDHVPYLDRGMPALLTIENDWNSYPDYHSTTDLPGNLSLEMGGETLRMNVAVVAEMGLSLLLVDGFETGDTSRWSETAP